MSETSEQIRVCEVALAALYLRGGRQGRVSDRRHWRGVHSAVLRRHPDVSQLSDALREERFYQAALELETPGLLTWAEELVSRRKCITAASTGYPARWLQRLAGSAPPAMWQLEGAGSADMTADHLSIVGSRRVDEPVVEFAYQVGRLGGIAGFSIVSGNATGCDEAGMKGARSVEARVIGILPCGIQRFERRLEGVTYWSVCAPDEEFATAIAMERNTLIYAASAHSVVVHARLREGGTWHGAVDANRRKLTQLVVRSDDGSAGNRALIALGGVALAAPSELSRALAEPGPQPRLMS